MKKSMTKHTKPSWIVEAESHVGLKEIKGAKHNPKIVEWLKSLKAWWFDDEQPWCATFTSHCLKATGHVVPKEWYRAKSFLNWGKKLSYPAYGSIAVKSRKGGGHVTFIVGQDAKGNLLGLGGNQGDAVNINAYTKADFEGFFWPADAKEFPSPVLPILNSAGKATSEA